VDGRHQGTVFGRRTLTQHHVTGPIEIKTVCSVRHRTLTATQNEEEDSASLAKQIEVLKTRVWCMKCPLALASVFYTW